MQNNKEVINDTDTQSVSNNNVSDFKEENDTSTSTEKTMEQFIADERDKAIKTTIAYANEANPYILQNGEKLLITTYVGSEPHNIPDGIIVLRVKDNNEYEILSEVKENFGVMDGLNSFEDITGDGIPEVFSSWVAEKSNYNYIWLYTLQGEELVPINFKENVLEPRNRVTTYGYGDEIKDIDNDGIKELILGKRIEKEDDWEVVTDIYKFDGNQYYLWKGQQKPLTAQP